MQTLADAPGPQNGQLLAQHDGFESLALSGSEQKDDQLKSA